MADLDIKEKEKHVNQLAMRASELKDECVLLERSNEDLVLEMRDRTSKAGIIRKELEELEIESAKVKASVTSLLETKDTLSTQLSQAQAELNRVNSEKVETERILIGLRSQEVELNTNRLAKQEELGNREREVEQREFAASQFEDALKRKQGILENREKILYEESKAHGSRG